MIRQTIPAVLYKYLRPDQLYVLTRGQLRVSQRQVVDDPKEFQAECVAAAPPDILEHFIGQRVAEVGSVPEQSRAQFTRYLAQHFGDEMLSMVRQHLKVADELGMVCLTDDPDNEQMWNMYADHGRGFVVGLDVRKFAGTIYPRLVMDRVIYSEDKLRYLSEAVLERQLFYQKATKWARQREWRGTHFLRRFPVIGTDPKGWPIHVCSIPFGTVMSVSITTACAVEWELRHLFAIDCRYDYLRLQVQP